ncbi:mannose-6-phosphate isomerase, class I [Avibacterium paragallinarum]|uniref:mannose-6-phosphate isomerase n=2 Tax=Avibacterium paragallinarum TaxID=728 RepID=A0A3G8W1T9_AVIPA|nr:mannose-6-phosphate isomerase, class I [Avibacterium paragallinarum]POY46914.1 mannose-6-phosphate isomerase, class I [Avibacterium paragallinarum]RZN56743.1 mannose-6-phosphate isomerase, class I [Avibacterium paragallinarum]RZN61498.1 mannose-6-phosphate isomerase, class I [Avibacterium paragallinarum]RZN77494.1 mannose-6-phosphate isomerase, class I [Avibacterium paragallinarum]
MTMLYPLNGQLQHYVWGGHQFLPEFLGIPAEQNQYYAEWWLGDHSSAPSIIEENGTSEPLNAFLAKNPTALGDASRTQFGDNLPYLLKILDVKLPLSIQLHPTKSQAEQGFAKENALGIALNDPKRTYKDNNHKPEMMIALSDFWLLHGFKTKQAILQTLQARPSLVPLAEKLAQQSLTDFYADIMQADQQALAAWLNPIIQANQSAYAQNQLSLENPDYWVLYTIEAMKIPTEKLDAGLICFYLFNIVHLKKGEGIFQDAGIPHAYLRGQNIELMACSDNVIRGGLTPKHVDVAELLNVIDCREVVPQIIPLAPIEQAIFTYSTPAKDFALTQITYEKAQTHQLHSESAEILLVMSGEIKIRENHTALYLKQGQSAFISAGSQYEIEGMAQGYAVIAALPKQM